MLGTVRFDRQLMFILSVKDVDDSEFFILCLYSIYDAQLTESALKLSY